MATEVAKPNLMEQKNKNDAISLQVSLPQMLDLALGTPQVGAVNLNILHNFLHVLLHLSNLDSAKVEYRGDHANRLKTVVETSTKEPSLQLHEYNITDGSGKVRQRDAEKEASKGADVYTEASKEDASAPASAQEKPSDDDSSQVKTTKGAKRQIGGVDSKSDYQTVIFVEPIIDGAAPTTLAFKQLDQSVKELQQRFQALEELQSNPEIMERLKGKITDPLTDMWQIININKRLDANEQGIDKLMSMVQDLAKSRIADGLPTESETEETPVGSMGMEEFNQKFKDIEQAILDLQATVGQTPVMTENDPSSVVVKEEVSEDQDATENAEDEKPQTSSAPDKKQSGKKHSSIAGGVNIVGMHGDVEAIKNEMSQIRTDVYDLNTKVEGIISGKLEDGNAENVAGESSKESYDGNLAQCWEAIENFEKTYGDDLNEVKNRLSEIENEMEKTEAGNVEDRDLNELVGKIQSIQSDMEKFNKIADRLVDDKEDRETHMNALLEQIELLKTIKADKEDLEDALADKADAQMVNRKVSHDQFDAACDDLARGLEEAVTKLGKQECVWQEALDEVQKEIEGKVDKLEITPLKDFVSNRLKLLQDKLKQVAERSEETDAAGTKKILRDVQCISCEKNVVMKTEDSGKFQAQPLPCNMSIKPYLTYELDQVRKQQRRLPHGRNLHMFEAAVNEETKKIKSTREEAIKTPRDHLCNRYCGGSHTVTTPQQRVIKMGHSLMQWGPKAIQLTEGIIGGTDEQSYKCKTHPDKPDICGSFCEGQETPADLERPPIATSTPQAQRKSQQSKRSSTASRRKGSRKISGEQVTRNSMEYLKEEIKNF